LDDNVVAVGVIGKLETAIDVNAYLLRHACREGKILRLFPELEVLGFGPCQVDFEYVFSDILESDILLLLIAGAIEDYSLPIDFEAFIGSVAILGEGLDFTHRDGGQLFLGLRLRGGGFEGGIALEEGFSNGRLIVQHQFAVWLLHFKLFSILSIK
jgi:hypothetical protein